MPDLLLDIGTFLQSNNLIQGDGIDFFRDFMPHEPDSIIVAYEYQGTPILSNVSANRNIQLQVRDTSYSNAKSKINSIYDVLIDQVEKIRQLTSERWGIIYSQQTPYKLKIDDNNRTVFVFNFTITTYKD